MYPVGYHPKQEEIFEFGELGRSWVPLVHVYIVAHLDNTGQTLHAIEHGHASVTTVV